MQVPTRVQGCSQTQVLGVIDAANYRRKAVRLCEELIKNGRCFNISGQSLGQDEARVS